MDPPARLRRRPRRPCPARLRLKGAGKTTTALLLASRGAQLFASDRAFVKVVGGELRVLPWPSAAAIGLGPVDALGLYDVVCDRLQAGEQLNPTQHQEVTDALLTGRREPLWEPGGKHEKTVQVFPDQFATWFGFMSGATEDRYPDHIGLAAGINGGGSELARPAVTDRLAALPHHQVVLSHDIQASSPNSRTTCE